MPNLNLIRAVANRRNSFKLIELLVVIAIIAILFPVFAQARDRDTYIPGIFGCDSVGLLPTSLYPY